MRVCLGSGRYFLNLQITSNLVCKRFGNMSVLVEPIEYLPGPERCIANLAAENSDAEEWLYKRQSYIPCTDRSSFTICLQVVNGSCNESVGLEQP